MKSFWQKQANEYKDDIKAVNFDPISEELELYFLERLIDDEDLICDLGCGNGRTCLEIAKLKPRSKFYGIDFVKEMIDIAQEGKGRFNASNVNFYVGDAVSENTRSILNLKFDKVFTKRLLINIKGEGKRKAVENIYYILKEKGTYIMIECFIEPLIRINRIRKALGLEEIKVKPFNEYLNLEFLNEINDLFEVKTKIDFASLYYFTSRVYNACLSEGKIDYFAPINKIAAKITKMCVMPIEGYSPEIIFVLTKK